MKKNLIPVVVALLALGAAGCGPEVNVQRALFEKAAQQTHRAVTPERTNVHPVRQQWIIDQLQKQKVDLLFIGDSITHGWDDESPVGWEPAGEVWDEYYGNLNAFNAGLSSDRTEHLLWRLENGIMENVAPKVVVMMIGTNNNGRAEYTPQQTADGVIMLCATLRQQLPQTRILLLGIFPREQFPDSEVRKKNQATNSIIANLHDGEWIHYLDISDQFLQTDGTISEAVFYDFVHPSAKGYRIWAQAMAEKLEELLR